MTPLRLPDGVPVVVGRCPCEPTIDLRHRILREGMPRAAALFDLDHAAGTRHYAVWLHQEPGPNGSGDAAGIKASGPVIAVCRFSCEPWLEQPAWRLRGMAVDGPWQGRGVGSAMLGYAQQHILQESCIRLLWCNARVPAVLFYRRVGWTVCSEPFDIPTAGPHVKMTCLLGQN